MSKTTEEPLSTNLLNKLKSDDSFVYISTYFDDIISELKRIEKNEEIKSIFDNLYLEHVVNEFINNNDDSYDKDNIEILDYYFNNELKSVIISQFDEQNNSLSNNSYFLHVLNNFNKLEYTIDLFSNEDFSNEELLLYKLKILRLLKDLNYSEDVVEKLFGKEIHVLYCHEQFYDFYELFLIEFDLESESLTKDFYENLLDDKLYVIFKIMIYLNPTFTKYSVLVESNNSDLDYILNDNLGLYALHFIYSDDFENLELTDKEVEEITLAIIDHLDEDFDDEIYEKYINNFNSKEIDLLIAKNVSKFMQYFEKSNIDVIINNEVTSVSFLEKEVLYACFIYAYENYSKEFIVNNKKRLIDLFNEYSCNLLIDGDEEEINNIKKRVLILEGEDII